MELSSLIGKQILSPNGEVLGYVKNAYLTQGNKKISSLECVDGEEEEFYISARSVISVGDAVIATRSRLTEPTGIRCPIGTPAYTYLGESAGVLGDILLGDAAPVYILIKDGVRISCPSECISCGDRVIVYPDKKTRLSATRTKSAGRAPVQRAKPAPKPAGNVAPAEKAETREADLGQDSDYRCNLLGRTVKKSLYDCYGFPIAVAGEKITPAILSAARRNNLLLRLTVNTLTNLY